MARLALPWMRPLSRREWISSLVIGLSILTYFTALKVMDHRAETYFADTRSTNPELYLEQLRASRGFDAFLPEYAALDGFDTFTPRPPDFLIGRWTMREEALRLATGELPEQCSNPITFDHGLVLMVEPKTETVPVEYRISENGVDVRTAGGDIFTVAPVSFGAVIDHLEFVPPGRDAPVLAYFCGG